MKFLSNKWKVTRPSLVPRPRPAFRRLQYGKVMESWVGPGNEANQTPSLSCGTGCGHARLHLTVDFICKLRGLLRWVGDIRNSWNKVIGHNFKLPENFSERRNLKNSGKKHKYAIPASKEELPVGRACCHVVGARITQQLTPWLEGWKSARNVM